MLLAVLTLFSTIFLYANSLYYSLILLFIVSLLLFILVINSIISSLTILILLIVYVGAIIVLIGYICAICPNLNLSSNIKLFKLLFPLLFIVSIFTFPLFHNTFNSKLFVLSNYFFNPSGVSIFLLIICLLFITLLIVTSQYLTPKGPFRSLKL